MECDCNFDSHPNKELFVGCDKTNRYDALDSTTTLRM